MRRSFRRSTAAGDGDSFGVRFFLTSFRSPFSGVCVRPARTRTIPEEFLATRYRCRYFSPGTMWSNRFFFFFLSFGVSTFEKTYSIWPIVRVVERKDAGFFLLFFLSQEWWHCDAKGSYFPLGLWILLYINFLINSVLIVLLSRAFSWMRGSCWLF